MWRVDRSTAWHDILATPVADTAGEASAFAGDGIIVVECGELPGLLTAAILDAGQVPYDTHPISNVPPAALATSPGCWPAWVQWYARERR